MIISRTPYRISLFGGGTDIPSWYQKHGGAVVSAAIDKYCYLSVRHLPPFFDFNYRVSWSKIEKCKTIDEIEHPAVRAVLGHMENKSGLEIQAIGDLPARSGMGSSSTFTVGLLKALYALNGKMIPKHDLAMEAIHIEQNVLKEAVGSQDQVAAAYGGLNRIEFHPNGEISVIPVTVSPQRMQELESHLMLFYTGIKRTSSNIQEKFIEDINAKRRQLRIMRDLVDECLEVLNSEKSILQLGDLLHEAWDAKRGFSQMVSNPDVDNLHAAAIEAGAIGGKLTGAGGGGFLLLFVPPAKQSQVREALNHFIHVPFRFEFSGSQVIFADMQSDHKASEVAKVFQPIQEFRELSDLSEG